MKIRSLLTMICTVCSVGIAALVAPSSPRPRPMRQPIARTPETLLRPLTPLEEAIAQEPFAPKAARIRLAEALAARQTRRRFQSLLPESTAPSLAAGQSMGWMLSDRAYWDHIPSAARRLPKDWSHLPVVRFTNTELGGVREIRLRRGPEYDQWLLRDPLHALTACISIRRSTRRIYFMEIEQGKAGEWRFKASHDLCYTCHPSGPRVIRPLDEPVVDHPTLVQFNRLILSYGACDFGEDVDAAGRGEAETDTRCIGCHDGKQRGRLYAAHTRPITFKTQREQTMPPD